MKIQNFNDFTTALLDAGFSTGGENSEGIFSLCSLFGDQIAWHTNDPETDPWEWRMRVLEERCDIAYAKVFFNKSGFITKDWYPYFLAVRRGGKSFEEAYSDGTMSVFAKRIYGLVSDNKSMPFHLIKQFGNFSKEDSSRFERAIVELQMKMYITMCGRQRKASHIGEEYGWSSTVFCTTEILFGSEVFDKAAKITEQEAVEKITAQVYKLNPLADAKKIMKFIKG